MWFQRILHRQPKKTDEPLLDGAFMRRLEQLSLQTTPLLRGALWGERRSRNLRPAFDFSDHRPYAGGDDLRHIDWNVYGRHEELFVKLGEATQSVNLHLFLDRSRSMAWDPAQKTELAHATSLKWAAALRLAASLAYVSLAAGERVTITPLPGEAEPAFGPSRGKRQAVPLLRFLSGVTQAPAIGTESKQSRFVAQLERYARQHPEGGVLILISDLWVFARQMRPPSRGSKANEGGLARVLRHFAPPRWQTMVLHLLTGEEVSPTLEGDYDLFDVETGERLPFHFDAPTLSRYRQRVDRWQGWLKAQCASRGTAYHPLLADWPLEQMLIPYLRQRGVIQ